MEKDRRAKDGRKKEGSKSEENTVRGWKQWIY